MGGFIVLDDGRAYAAANWAIDETLRVIAAELDDLEFKNWLLAQQCDHVGAGMTSVERRLNPACELVLAPLIAGMS